MTKRRVQKKHYRVVREGLAAGKPVPRFYLYRVRQYYGDFIDYRYLTVFRPYWYDQFDKWGELDLTAEHKKHFDETLKMFAELSGLDLEKLHAELKKNKRTERKRKPRKEKPADPVRKLRNPEKFTIWCYRKGKLGPEKVEGEKVFEVNGYSFFIRHDGHFWIVSDTAAGAAIAKDLRYREAVRRARERIEKNFDQYLKKVEQSIALRGEANG